MPPHIRPSVPSTLLLPRLLDDPAGILAPTPPRAHFPFLRYGDAGSATRYGARQTADAGAANGAARQQPY